MDWDFGKSLELYRTASWGGGYFDVNSAGHIVVRPERPHQENGNGSNGSRGPECDLYDLVCSLKQRGTDLPILLRFDGIIKNRVGFLYSAFEGAIKEANYQGAYHLAYPLKVNQQRHVVETLLQGGAGKGMGLQVGSKAEFMAVLAIHDEPGAILLCNGFKDQEYIELALLATRLGRRVILVVEQSHELERILDVSAQLGIDAELGIRMKPFVKGVHGEALMSDKSKFGLSPVEVVQAVELLKASGKTDTLKLLHFHVGTQVTSIGSIKKALREATRMYVELARICPALHFFNAGGGLAVDYDGSNTNFESSMNYSVEEYARDVVGAIEETCREAGIAHPDLITESGRALVAQHAVLVAEVIDVAPATAVVPELEAPPGDHELLLKIQALYADLTVENCQETLHDALELKDDMLELFVQGDLSMVERAYAERVFRHLIAKIRQVSQELNYRPDDMEGIDDDLRDVYFCNFSVFQSLPDSWAINRLFPIMPIHRLCEQPVRNAVIADLTCDSDGKIERFIDLKDVSSYLPFHTFDNGPYYVGVFLVGAYQEILGDLHNLFGDSHAVHVNVCSDGRIELTHLVEGDRVRDVLSYVQYDTPDLLERLRVSVENSLNEGLLTPEESARIQKRYREALDGYTYLVK